MRKELLKEIRTELNRFEGKRDQDKRPDPFNFEKEGKSNQSDTAHDSQTEQNVTDNSRTGALPKASVGTVDTQLQISEREKALQAQVKELQWKLDMLLRNSKGAKGDDKDQGIVERGNSRRKTNVETVSGNDQRGSYQKQGRGYDEHTRPSPCAGNSRQVTDKWNYSDEYDADDSGRLNIDRDGKDDDRYPRTAEDRTIRREGRTNRDEGHRDWDRFRDPECNNTGRSGNRRRTEDGYRPDSGRQRRSMREREDDEPHRYRGHERYTYRDHRVDHCRRDLDRMRHPRGEYSSDEISDEELWEPRRRNQQPRVQRRISENGIRDVDRRMEKWHLSFSGDVRSRSLEDFLLKVRRLAKMDRIADDVLMQRIHTVLRGEAYDWYLCYADEFQNWEHFEERIRYMYGNPNKDQGNRQKIYERKQNRNESFLSFKMEVERLNKLLSKPLDQQRIFEVIWDNMRPHYRSKLACRTVQDLRKLEYYAYRIDANDPVFRQTREGPSKANAVHNIELEEQADSYSSESGQEEVNAVGSQFNRDRKSKEQRSAETNTRSARVNAKDSENTPQSPLCWNCRKIGHLWRNCPQEKQLFCYWCGEQGKTVATYEKHPGDRGRPSREPSGN